MPLWPFRRKSGRKRPRSGAAFSDVEGPPVRSQTEGAVTRADSKKKQRIGTNKAERGQRTYSFSPGKKDDLGPAQRRQASPDRAGPSTRRRDDADASQPYPWTRTPTLHHKTSRSDTSRRKSTKRKQEEKDRAAEIKALSEFQPVRPTTESWNAGRPMKKDSRRVKATSGLGRHPASDISLPIPGSVHSSLSSDSEFGAFKVSALDALAPRPTLRYSQGTRWTGSRHAGQPHATYPRKDLEKEPIAEEPFRGHRRVDDLADELDARDLRELMEREDRRQEKKRQQEQERAQRRLNRQAERQKREEAASRAAGTPPENLERGTAGRAVGLGIDPASAVVTTSEPEPESKPEPALRHSTVSEPMPDAPEQAVIEEENQLEKLDSAQPTITAGSQHPNETVEPQDSATSLGQSSRFAGILRSKKSKSRSTLASERDRIMSPPPEIIDEEGNARQGSWSTESKRGRFSLTSFIRWGGKSKRHSGGPPSSFSNTSREEMQAAAAAQNPAQAHHEALAKLQGDDAFSGGETSTTGIYMARKTSAGAALRMRSRFREDLPEYPMSPPDSRLQSPEVEPALATIAQSPTEPVAIPGSSKAAAHLSSTSAEPITSMSLASIDSEGSWLSGRVNSKRSAIRGSIARANRREQVSASPSNSTQEDLAIADDDYLARLAPHRHSGHMHAPRRSEDGRPSSDEEDFGTRESGARWGAIGARPQVIHVHRHDRMTMQSHEGLLNIESGDEAESESPVTPSAHEQADLRRAQSVNLGKGGHARNFSAGSAKLLELTPRTSVDSKAKSNERRRSSGQLMSF
ncbi:uncharacterized protein F5Z01DRAFT_626613 [Emericellopsis atlantica]|uniref:Uncharacterized protein n=1 Tax=Emericellopsis atlantica TaxID=2614577 RepID=A0A9P7ZH51_9HYPO|nr:uncharacterized protein F5Z01DRAFT_626613 [Emericellopsis atlantica]KAG9251920.1 hypothetical protein F5Z01DRAFT_626613 [Emericellopsis atlantica]